MKKTLLNNRLIVLSITVLFLVAGCHPQKKLSKQNDPADELIKLGNKKVVLKNYKGAIIDFTTAISMNADIADAYLFRAVAYYNLKDYANALTDVNKAIEMQPTYGEAYDLRGCIKGDKGDKVGSCEDWQKAFDNGYNPAADLLEKFCKDK